MVFLAITPEGLQRALESANGTNIQIWCGADAISDVEYSNLSGVSGANLSRFTYPLLGQTADALQGALDTIEEHHPGESVWVEYVTSG